MASLLLIVGLAWVAHGFFLYWAYGLPTAFGPDGVPRGYAPRGRPEMVRDLSRIFRLFSRGATALVVLGLGLIAAYFII